MRAQIGNSLARENGQLFGHNHRRPPYLLRALRQHYPKLGQQATDPIDRRRALLDEPLPHPMQRQDCLLLGALHRHEAHVGPSYRFADRFGVVAVVLRALAIRSHKARHHDPDAVTVDLKLAPPLVRATAGFHADQARRQSRDQLH